MKTGNKIAWIYTLLMMALVVSVGSLFYWLTARSTNQVYETYLSERAYAAAEKYWEEDELDAESYALVKKRYERALSPAKEIVLNADSTVSTRQTISRYLDEAQIRDLYAGRTIHFNTGEANRQGVAIYYPDNEGNFIIIVLSDNRYGADILLRMKWLLLAALCVTGVLVYGVGKLYASRLVNRIDEAYRREKAFISNASHEINNPLTAIQGECEITLMRHRSTDEYQSALQRISAEAHRISTLMKHLLFLSKADRELSQSAIQPIRLDEFLSDLAAAPVTFSATGSDMQTFANPHLLKIAIRNILDNACKYSSGREVRMTLCGKQLTIEDSGIGIPREDIKRILLPFYRAGNARNFEGNGIGLALSVQILKAYKAKVHITSDEGKGTRVTIMFS